MIIQPEGIEKESFRIIGDILGAKEISPIKKAS